MRYYRTPETGEIVAFDLAHNAWFDLRCDASTAYKVRFVPTRVTTAQALALQSISEAEYLTERDRLHAANATARGEALLREIGRQRSSGTSRELAPNEHVSGGQWPGPFPV